MAKLAPILILFVPLLTFAQPARTQEAEQQLTKMMKDYNVPGMAVAVIKKGELVYNHSFGFANLEDSVALTNENIFRIASISKSFSAVSIMQLVEEKKISLNDDFSKLIGFPIRNPKFPKKVITLKMVLSHTSSVNDSQGYFNLDVINPAKNPDFAKCYNSYAPGKGYQYCNLNFNMIGAVLEKLRNQRFDVCVKEHVLNPLGLQAGYCVDSLDAKKFVTLYDYDTAEKTFTPSPQAYAPRLDEISHYTMGYTTPIFSPTGGLKISAKDLSTYMTMHMYNGIYKGTKIISAKSAKRMRKALSKPEGYGLALMTSKDLIPGKVMKGHTGSAYGLYSAMFFHPKEKFGIVVIVNGSASRTESNYIRDVLRSPIGILYNNFIKQ